MTIESSERASRWLAQIHDPVDREIGRQMLRALRLVSHSEFERGVQFEIEKILSSVGKENVALISVTEPKPQIFDEGKERRTPGSSADRVRHMVENLRRVHGDRVLANPTVDSMRAERIRNIVIVEDYVGTGKRVSDFWTEQIDTSIKSWVSYGWTKLWLVTFAADAEGLRQVCRRVPKLTSARIHSVLPTTAAGIRPTMPMTALAIKYAQRISKSGMPLGFGSRGTLVVFEHGCPNNAPTILWDFGRKWSPIFPNRGIPTDIRHYFDDANPTQQAESLWDHGQYSLAVGLLDHVRLHQASPMEWRLLLALGHSSRSGWNDTRLAERLLILTSEVAELRRRAYRLGVIDTQTHRLTIFGREFLSLVKRGAGRENRGPRSSSPLRRVTDLYYPDSCGGVTKHQSNVAT
ncbi:phosphoribosyltransferase-like protein [Cupriavidus basilensis]|uniref:phosphoribosyltransferase-like protein n=1 Tax=Cupriavidus basilensis TaxID=68895 RepID=UPI000A62695B